MTVYFKPIPVLKPYEIGLGRVSKFMVTEYTVLNYLMSKI